MSKSIQIIEQGDEGNYEPVLATFDELKALAKYKEIIKSCNKLTPAQVQARGLKCDDTNVPGIDCCAAYGSTFLCVDGEWYEFTDQYDEVAAKWFSLEVE